MPDYPFATAALNRGELERLAQYNAECARGIVHTADWDKAMADLQARFDRHTR